MNYITNKTNNIPNDLDIYSQQARLDEAIKHMDRSIIANMATGMGTSIDKSNYNRLRHHIILQPTELEVLYDGSWLCQNVINKIIDESTREWLVYKISGQEGTPEEINNLIEDYIHYQDSLVDEKDDDISVKDLMVEALFYERLFGGAVIICNLDDGREHYEPVDWARIKSIKWMQVLDRHQVLPVLQYGTGDLSKPDYYQLNGIHNEQIYFENLKWGDERVGLIHKDRVIRFPGVVKLPHRLRQENQGWGRSILQAFYRPFEGVEVGVNCIMALMQEMDRLGIKIKGLWDIIRAGNEELLRKRVVENTFFASQFRRELLDADGEEIVNITRNVQGVVDLVKLMLNIAVAASGLPHTFLLGESPGGLLGGTGESTQTDLNRLIRGYQSSHIDRPFKKLNKLCWLARNSPTKGKVPKGFAWDWLDPYPMTQQEKASLEQTYASIDATNINSSVYSGEEAAISRYGSATYGYNINIDWEARKKEKAKEENYVPEEVNYSGEGGENSETSGETTEPAI